MERIEVIYQDGSKDIYHRDGPLWFWSEEVPEGTAHEDLAVKRLPVNHGSIIEALAEAFLRAVQGQPRG